jgi:hypothetical protein
MYEWREFAAAGGLISYGPSLLSGKQDEKTYCLTEECSRGSKRCLTKRVPIASRSSGRAAAPFPDF